MTSQLIILTLAGFPIAYSDIKSRLIPNRYLLVTLLLSIFARAIFDRNELAASLEALLITVPVVALLHWVFKARIGMGDLKLILLLSFMLANLPRELNAWLAALIFALITAVIMRSKRIPFAPALILGALICL